MASPLSLCLLALTTAVCMISTANANALPFSTNGGRNLYLGPDEFVVRGINYNPVPIGLDPTLEHDYYVTEKHRIWERDLPLLRDMNVNMIRLYGWNNALDHTAFLDACFNGGLQSIFVALTFWFPKQDLTDTFVRSKLKRHFAAMVASVQSHPAIAMYLIGNEFNSASWYGASAEQLQSFVELANDLGAIAHELDPNHVVALPLSDEKLVDFIATWDSKLANIDIWALQLYRGLTYGNFFNVVANVTTRPLLMSEFGIDAWDDRAGAVSEDMQAEAAVALWNEIEAASNVTIGGIAFAFSDEWWKSRVADRDARHPNCPESNPFVQSTCGHSNSALPDGYSNEEYYGMFSISQGEGARADSMTPRKVVDAIRVAFLRSRKAGVQPSLLVDYDFNVKVAIVALWMALALVVLAMLASLARTSTAERWAKKGADSLAAIRSFCCYVFVPASRRYEYSEKEFEVSGSFDRESIDELTSWTPSPAVAAAPFCTSLYIADSTSGSVETHGDADESAARKESAKFEVFFQSTTEANATRAALDDECVVVAAASESTPLSSASASKSPFRSYTC